MLITDIEKRIIYITQLENPLKRLNIYGAERMNKDGDPVEKKPKFKYGVSYNNVLLRAIKNRYLQGIDKRRKKWTVQVLAPGKSPWQDKGGSRKTPSKLVMRHAKYTISRRKFQGQNKVSWQDLTSTLKKKEN